MHKLTKAQHEAIEQMYFHHKVDQHMTLGEFKCKARPVLFGDGAVAVKIPGTGMFICVETDGHRHT